MTLRALYDRALNLEQGYAGMVLQADEVDERIRLWRRVIELGQEGADDEPGELLDSRLPASTHESR
jgi:hypothetical protein